MRWKLGAKRLVTLIPEKAAEGTIRKDFATSLSKNAVHGADSDENAELEIHFFFNESELINSE